MAEKTYTIVLDEWELSDLKACIVVAMDKGEKSKCNLFEKAARQLLIKIKEMTGEE